MEETKESIPGKLSKFLVTYEMDLATTQLVRKVRDPLPDTANMLIPLGAGTSNCGGVLVCCEDFLVVKSIGTGMLIETKEHIAYYPRRKAHLSENGVLMTTSSTLKLDQSTFALIQSEFGDLYRVKLEKERVIIQYFDSIPPAVSLCIAKNGTLFTPSEKGNQYQHHSLTC
jgi:splicing factor 3B subunit 3